MKPVFSGWHIYETIRDLEKEINELQEASYAVEDEVGTGSVAHNVLMDEIKKKNKELKTFKETKYTVYEKPSLF